MFRVNGIRWIIGCTEALFLTPKQLLSDNLFGQFDKYETSMAYMNTNKIIATFAAQTNDGKRYTVIGFRGEFFTRQSIDHV